MTPQRRHRTGRRHCALAEAVARAESAKAELVLLALERREELNIAVARLLLVRAGWPADLLVDELMAEVWRRPSYQHTSDDGRVTCHEDVMTPWRPLLWEAGFFTEHGESDAGESDAGWLAGTRPRTAASGGAGRAPGWRRLSYPSTPLGCTSTRWRPGAAPEPGGDGGAPHGEDAGGACGGNRRAGGCQPRCVRAI